MTTTTLHIDHRKVTVSISELADGRIVIRPTVDAGASSMWEEKKNPIGQFIRDQWKKTATRRNPGFAVIRDSSIINQIVAV
jgi:hypothetical protein